MSVALVGRGVEEAVGLAVLVAVGEGSSVSVGGTGLGVFVEVGGTGVGVAVADGSGVATGGTVTI